MASNHDHPAHVGVVSRERSFAEMNPGGDPTAICLPSSHPPVHSYRFRARWHRPRVSTAGSRSWRRRACRSSPTRIRSSPRRSVPWPAWPTRTPVSSRSCRPRPKSLREHEEQTDFAMSAARSGVSYRDLGSSWVELSSVDRDSCLDFLRTFDASTQDELYQRVHPDDAPRGSCRCPEGD